MYTEAEAKTKWCPLARTLDFDGKDCSAPHNRVYRVDYNVVQSDTPGRNCIASDCMAWRWADGLDLIDSMVAERNGSRRGLCGAFGNPKAGAA